jgi:hypothetical protein
VLRHPADRLRHQDVADPPLPLVGGGPPPPGHVRRDERRSLRQDGQQVGGGRAGNAVGEAERGPQPAVAGVDAVPMARRHQPGAVVGPGEEHPVPGRSRLRRGAADHRGADELATGCDLVADRPPGRDGRPVRADRHRARHRRHRGARRRVEGVVGHDDGRAGGLVGSAGTARAQGGEDQPSGGEVGDGNQPLRPVRDDVHRAGRRPGDDRLVLPSRAGHQRRVHRGPAQPEQSEHHAGQRRAPLRPDLFVQRYRVAADQRGLQPAQAEPVGVGLVAGGGGPHGTRSGHLATLAARAHGPWAFHGTRRPDRRPVRALAWPAASTGCEDRIRCAPRRPESP